MTSAGEPAATTADRGRARWFALGVVCLAQLMSVADGTIVNVALPSIQRGLGFSQANLTWVVNGYLISYGSFLLLSGRLGDLVGRRRVFLGGVALFTLSSAACGLASSQTMLIVARFLQGLGGAGATSAIMAIIATEFTEPPARAKAMSAYMLVVACGGSLGLLAGGVITQSLNWHWIFFINVPIGLLTFTLARRWVSENPAIGIGRDLDVGGALLVTGAIMLAAYAIVTSSSYGWGSAHTISLAATAIGLLVAFALLESRLSNPIMPLRIFAIRGLAATSIVRGLLITGMYAPFFIGALYMQHIRGYSVLQTGIGFLPQTLVLATLSTGITARLAQRYGPRAPALAGLAFAAGGLAMLTQIGTHTPYVISLLPGFALIGLGAGLAFMPLLTIALEHVPPADAGAASGIINTSLQLAAALGVAMLATIASDHTQTLLHKGNDHVGALLGGYHLAFAAATGCMLAGIATTLITVRKPAEREVPIPQLPTTESDTPEQSAEATAA